MSQYKFEIWDDSGNLLADLTGRAHDRAFTVSRNLPEQISFSLGLNEIEKFARDTNVPIRTLINAGVNEIRIKKGTDYILGGKMDVPEVTINGDQRNLSVRASGFLNLLDDRYAGENTIRTFSSTDAGTIAKTLVDETQVETNGNFGIQTDVAWIEPTVNRDMAYERRRVKDAIIELASLSNGFDFEFTYDKKFKVYQSIGQDRTDLVFNYPGNIRNLRLPIDSSRLANRIIARGAGQGGSQYTSTVEDTVSQGTYKLRTAIVDLPTETQSANLTAKANEVIRIYALPLEIPSITLDGKLAPRVGLDFWIGDSIKLSIKEVGILETLTAVWRVEEITVKIDDNDTETISLKLSK